MARRKRQRRQGKAPEFAGKIKNWALSYLRRHYWRVASMWDREDLESEALVVFWRCRRYHPNLTDEAGFLRLYRCALYGHVEYNAKACFPNPYNVGTKNNCMSLTGADGRDLTDVIVDAVYNPMVAEVDQYLDLTQRLPEELRGAFIVLIREFLGIESIPRRSGERLNGEIRLEPIEVGLARAVGVDVRRDLIEEIGFVLGDLSTQGQGS